MPWCSGAGGVEAHVDEVGGGGCGSYLVMSGVLMSFTGKHLHKSFALDGKEHNCLVKHPEDSGLMSAAQDGNGFYIFNERRRTTRCLRADSRHLGTHRKSLNQTKRTVSWS